MLIVITCRQQGSILIALAIKILLLAHMAYII